MHNCGVDAVPNDFGIFLLTPLAVVGPRSGRDGNAEAGRGPFRRCHRANYESPGRVSDRGRSPRFSQDTVDETDLLEQKVETTAIIAADDAQVTVELRPFRLVTFRVRRA